MEVGKGAEISVKEGMTRKKAENVGRGTTSQPPR
jgi:hypothetical protein